MRTYFWFAFRAVFCIAVLVVWQRVRMGVPLEVVLENPHLLWSSAAEVSRWVK